MVQKGLHIKIICTTFLSSEVIKSKVYLTPPIGTDGSANPITLSFTLALRLVEATYSQLSCCASEKSMIFTMLDCSIDRVLLTDPRLSHPARQSKNIRLLAMPRLTRLQFQDWNCRVAEYHMTVQKSIYLFISRSGLIQMHTEHENDSWNLANANASKAKRNWTEDRDAKFEGLSLLFGQKDCHNYSKLSGSTLTVYFVTSSVT